MDVDDPEERQTHSPQEWPTLATPIWANPFLASPCGQPILANPIWANPFLCCCVLLLCVVVRVGGVVVVRVGGVGVVRVGGVVVGLDPPAPDPLPPKISLFFPSPAAISFFFSLSGCLLVEFWCCFEDRDPQVCTYDGPVASKTPPKINEKTPKRDKKKRHKKNVNEGGKGGKKPHKIWAPPTLRPTLRAPHPSGPPLFLGLGPHPSSHTPLTLQRWIGQNWIGQNWIRPKLAGPRPRWPKMDWPKLAKSGWPKVGLFRLRRNGLTEPSIRCKCLDGNKAH